MSESAETPEASAANLRRAIGQLPTHEPGPEAWLRMAARLAADAALARALPALPTHEPDDAVWAAIAGRLDAPASPARGRPWWLASGRVRRAWALAASLALLLAGGWWQWQHQATLATPALRETLAFSEETVDGPLPVLATAGAHIDPLERQGEAFIDAHCSSLPAVCQSGEFRALRTQLTELETQETELRQAAQRFGQSPELLREQTRLITLKASITRELVHLLIS